MRQHHAFRIARRARSVLQERNILAPRVMRQMLHRPPFARRPLRIRGRARQLLRVQHFAQRRHARLQQLRQILGLPPRHQKLRFRVAQNIRLPRRVLRDAIRPERRINRHGNSAREQYSRERPEKFRAGRQHDRDRLPRLEAPPSQIRRHHGRALVQLAKRDRAQLLVIFVNLNVAPPRFAASPQTKNFAQRFGLANLLIDVRANRGRRRTSGSRSRSQRNRRGRRGNRRPCNRRVAVNSLSSAAIFTISSFRSQDRVH